MPTQKGEKAAHTAGPWFLDRKPDPEFADVDDLRHIEEIHVGQDPSTSRYKHVAKIHHWGGHNEETEANARLIAAAPELLEACELALKYLRAQGHSEEFIAQWTPTKALLAAISKARGS